MKLTHDQADALTELVNIGVGRAAASLSELVGARVELSVPNIKLVTLEDVYQELGLQVGEPNACIVQDFDGPMSGRAVLLFPKEGGHSLARLLGGIDDECDELNSDDLNIEVSGILQEVGNIVLNSVMGSFANAVQAQLAYTVPELFMVSQPADIQLNRRSASVEIDKETLLTDVHFVVSQYAVNGSILIAFDFGKIEVILCTALSTPAENS